MMQNSRISHQAKNGNNLTALVMQKADAPEMPVQWSVFEGMPPKRKVRFHPEANIPFSKPAVSVSSKIKKGGPLPDRPHVQPGRLNF